MKELYQIPRFSLAWLLASLVAIILPHVTRLPIWLTLIIGLCVVGRILIFQGRMSYPRSLIKTPIVFVIFIGVIFQYGRDVFSTDATIAILIGSIALKLLEMQRKRDVLLVIYLCYFTIIGEFIYSQSIPIAVYMSFCALLVTSSLMSLNQSQAYQNPKRTLKLSATLLLQSIPLMLVLFVLFPRMPPLWSVPLQSNTGVTGLSDNMSPGDIGDLISSPDVAFKVKFEGEVPSSVQMYWRAITLDSFDGREWRRGFNIQPQYLGTTPNEARDWFEQIEYLGDIVSYNIIMEPSLQNWIYTLKIPQIQDDRLIMRRDFQVDSIRRIGQRFSYNARSYLNHRVDTSLSRREMRRALAIPETGNELSRAFAVAQRELAGSDEAYIQAILRYYREESFFYTLSPETLGENTVDDFIFNTKEGFCEHYSSSFTYLMRAAGVPARVVTGYQGGEYNPYDDTYTIRQYDAHAWSEVWLEGVGWSRVDPTAAVSPDRIDLGSQLTLQEQDSFLEDAGFSMLRFRGSDFLNNIRLRLEMIDYSWNRFVLNYNQDMQFDFFSRLFNSVTKQKIILTMIGAMILVVSIMVLIVLKKSARKTLHPATAIYLRYCQLLAKKGFERRSGETPEHYYQRLSETQTQWSPAMQGITNSYIDIVYKSSDNDPKQPDKIQKLKQLVRKFRLTS